MFTRSNFGDQGQYAAWAQAERLDPHAPGALTAEQVKTKVDLKGMPSIESLVVARKEDLENATLNGPLRMFPEDQWESLLLGPGIEGPKGEHTFIGFSQDTVLAAKRSLTWHSLPSAERAPDSYFVFGEGQVLVPRLPSHQPSLVRNPFLAASNLPFPPPPPFVPHVHHSASLSSVASMPKLSHHAPHTNNSSASLPPLPPRSTSARASITSSTPSHTPQHSHSQSSNHLDTNVKRTNSNSKSAVTASHAPTTHSSVGQNVQGTSGNRNTVASSSGSPGSSTTAVPSTRRASLASGANGEYGAHSDGKEKDQSKLEEAPRCPDEINGYCRSWNIAHQNICPYTHMFWSEAYDPTGYSSKYKYAMTKLTPGSPEFDYIKIRFINSWIHVQSKKPTVTKIKQVSCPLLERLFNKRQEEIAASGMKPNVTELYHGTCEANFATLFTQGFQPPADYGPNPQCPVSGPYADKLSTSLCKRTCKLCTKTSRHCWNVCHMWGLGIYCAIDSSKSDIYVSNKKGKKTDRSKRKMLLCSVILGEAENVKQLKRPDGMHDRVAPAPGKHSIFAVGWKSQTIPTKDGHTLGVMNDEYVVFHPHQIMPLYIIEYTK